VTDNEEPAIYAEARQALSYIDDGSAIDLVDPSFFPVDLSPVLAGHHSQPEPTILRRDDGQCLVYPGQVNGVHGDSGVGKGWFALSAIVQQITAGRTVMLMDTEDVATSIVARLRLLGATDQAIADRLIYVRPTAPFGTFAVDHLVDLVQRRNVALVVIDSLGECFGLDGIDENHDAEVGPWLRRVARRLADAGPAVLIVDHATKSNDNPLHPSGSKRKRAAIGGASYLITATKPLTAGEGGRLKITCAKDRHGTWARGEHVADLVMKTDLAGTRVELYAPDPADADDSVPVVLAARSAVYAVKAEGAPMSLRTLRAAMSIKAANGIKDGGIDLAVARGALQESAGPRKARLFTYVADLPDRAET
jgi:hypothetical protein